MSFETHAVIIQIPAAPERTLSRSKTHSTLHRCTQFYCIFFKGSAGMFSVHLSGTALSAISSRRAPGSKISMWLAVALTAARFSCTAAKKNGVKSIIMQKMGKNGGEGDTQRRATRLQFGRGGRGKRSEIHPIQNMVFFRITTNPGIFVCV